MTMKLRHSPRVLNAIAPVLVTLVALAPGLARSEAMQKPALTLSQAKEIIAAAEAEAARGDWPCVVAVVDDGGWLIAMERMDNPAMLVSVQLAPEKARSAAIFRKPTAELEKSINDGRTAAVTALGYVEMQGGVPLKINGQIVGAIGVSADTPAHDQQIADAGASALK